MAAIDFPSSPAVGATFTSAGVTWTWDGTKWVASGATGSSNIVSVQQQIFGTAGANTYTPSPGMTYCLMEGVGGGAGGNSCPGTASYYSIGGGGGGGAYARRLATAAQVGASIAVTIGAGGNAGVSNGFGGAGGDTSVGSLLLAKGAPAPTSTFLGGGGGSAAASVGDWAAPGQPGIPGEQVQNIVAVGAGGGGASMLGFGGANNTWSASTIPGFAAPGRGGGGTGGSIGVGGTVVGGGGGPGLVRIMEFCTQ